MSGRRIFLKQVGLSAVGLGLLPLLPVSGFAQTGHLPSVLPRCTPEEQGISSAGISRFLQAIKKSGQEFHSLMILRHGQVVAEGWW